MDAKELKSRLTIDHILTLMEDFGEQPICGRNHNELLFRTICHNGDSHKLYFYKDSMNFHCYTNCGSMDILGLLQSIMGISLVDAINYVVNRFGFSDKFQRGFGNQEIPDNDDWAIINKYKKKVQYKEELKEIKILDENLLNYFYEIYPESFYKDGISYKTMKKYGIMFDIGNYRIIIPHRDEEGNLIAIRCRNLEQELIDTGRKYMPVILNKQVLSAPTSQYFFGLYYNKETIKRFKKVILVESEKAVMQLDTMYPEGMFALALSSSSISNFQIDILKSLDVEEVIVALDKEYDTIGSIEEQMYKHRVSKTILERLKIQGMNVSVVWDNNNLLKRKQSPTDAGKQVFEILFNNRISFEILGG